MAHAANDTNRFFFVMEHDDITENYDMPSWNKFFDNLHESSDKTRIAYGPIFPESPTKASVVETSLDYFMKVMAKLGQNKTVVTCDQAIYDIAKGLAKKYSEKYANLILRLGGGGGFTLLKISWVLLIIS